MTHEEYKQLIMKAIVKGGESGYEIVQCVGEFDFDGEYSLFIITKPLTPSQGGNIAGST